MTSAPLGSLLIVDDEAPQLEALLSTLEAQGYDTTGTESGEDALEILTTRSFDLLLTDLKMPGIDGITLVRRAMEIDPALVAILMTGEGTIATAVEAMQVGAFDYILKPFRLGAMLPVLSRGLAIRRLRIANAALERSVREHTAELEALNKDLDAFASSVSHDLRAPLQAVVGFSSILSEKHGATLNAEARELVDLVRQAGEQGARLIDELLRFSRLGRQPLSKGPVDTGALVHAIVDRLRRAEPDRRVDVEIGPLPVLVADAALLEHVFENLLANAFKFTRQREAARIQVGVEDNERGAFFVRDNGAGFDMRYAGRLFGMFQRLHAQEEFPGTGVGLSLASRIVQRHDGTMWAEGETGTGATFYFTLGRS